MYVCLALKSRTVINDLSACPLPFLERGCKCYIHHRQCSREVGALTATTNTYPHPPLLYTAPPGRPWQLGNAFCVALLMGVHMYMHTTTTKASMCTFIWTCDRTMCCAYAHIHRTGDRI